MIELIAKIGFFLAVAMLIGSGIGWFVADVMRKKSILLETKALKSTIKERDKQLKMLEDTLNIQKTQLYKMTDEGIVNRHNLLKQSNTIRKQSDELFMIQEKLGQIKVMEKDKAECLKSIMELSLQLKEREEILSEYEKESLLSKNHENTTTHQEELVASHTFKEQVLKQEIEELKLLLEESHSKLSDEDMIISKDQFKYIEQEFGNFKNRVEQLEKENRELTYLLKHTTQKSSRIIEKVSTFFPFKSKNRKNREIKLEKQQEVKQI